MGVQVPSATPLFFCGYSYPPVELSSRARSKNTPGRSRLSSWRGVVGLVGHDGTNACANDLVLDPLFELWWQEAVLTFGWNADPRRAPPHIWDWPKHPVADIVAENSAKDTPEIYGTIVQRQGVPSTTPLFSRRIFVPPRGSFADCGLRPQSPMRCIALAEGGIRMRETKWVVPEKFFDQAGAVLDSVPPSPGTRPMMASSANGCTLRPKTPQSIEVALLNSTSLTIGGDRKLQKDCT